jgi:transposase
MSLVVIGMDPHKRSATIEVMAGEETVVGGGRYGTDAAGYAAMLAAVTAWPERIWAIEGCQGIGRHVANRLLADGERVVDVPPKLSARIRVFATGQGRKTDATDAHSIALAATRMSRLRPVAGDAQLAVLRILADRRRSLGEDHTRMVCQLHHLLLELIPRRGEERPVRGPGQGPAGQGPPSRCRGQGPPPGRRRADQRPRAALPAQEGRQQGTQCPASSHRQHADHPARHRPFRRRPAAGRSRRHQPVPQQSALRLMERHRPDRRLLRRPDPPPPVPGGQPPSQPRPAHHGRRPAAQPHRRPRLLRPQSRRRENTDGGNAGAQTQAVRHRLPPDGSRHPRYGNGPGRTRGGGYWLQRGRLQPQRRRFGEVTSRARHPRPYAQPPDPFSTSSPPLPASAGAQPRSSALCLTAARTGAHSHRRE